MRNRLSYFAIAIVALVLHPQVASAAPMVPLSLQQAIDTAVQSNTQYREAATAVAAANAGVKQARSAFQPGLSLQYTYQYQDYVSELATPFGTLPFAPNATNIPVAVLQYSLYDGGVSSAHFGQAAANFAAAEANQHAARNGIVLKTSKAYFDLIAAIRGADVADRAVSLASGHLKIAQQRFDVGMIPKAELLAAQTELATRQTEAIGAHNGVTLAQSALDAVMNVPLDTLHAPTEPLENNPPQLTLESLLTTAHQARSELAAAKEAMIAANLAIKAAASAKQPHVGVMMSEGNAQPVLMTGYHAQFTVGIHAVWSLFDGGYSDGAIAAARAGLEGSELALSDLQTNIDLEVRQAYANYTSATSQVTAAQHLVQLADENQRLAEIRYRGGVGTAIELRDAELRDVSANQQLLSAKVALRESLVALRYAAGLL